MLVPWPGLSFGLYIVSAAAVLGLTVACWRRPDACLLPLRYSALLLASVLVAPHLTVYDLVILAPAFLLLADWLVDQPAHALDPLVGNSSLPRVHASAAGTVHSMDTRSTFGDCDGGHVCLDLEHLARRHRRATSAGELRQHH